MNVRYPGTYFDYDPIGYYKPKTLSGGAPPTWRLSYDEYSHAADFLIYPGRGTESKDPYKEEHFAKVDPR